MEEQKLPKAVSGRSPSSGGGLSYLPEMIYEAPPYGLPFQVTTVFHCASYMLMLAVSRHSSNDTTFIRTFPPVQDLAYCVLMMLHLPLLLSP